MISILEKERTIIPKKDINWDTIRADFPILNLQIHGNTLTYLDNAATSQKPNLVIQAIDHYYKAENANIHRGVHFLSAEATASYEKTRETVRDFISAEKTEEIIFTKGTTESINLIASCFGKAFLKKGDKIMISALEHHSNIVPWQMIAAEKEAELVVIPMNQSGEIILEEFHRLLDERVKIVAISQLSNSLGTLIPIKYIIDQAHLLGIPVLIDGAQSAPHISVNVRELDCDFFVFSGHKTLGPTGIGILYGKSTWLEKLPPYQGGGEMIKSVSFEKTVYNEIPFKFEAGTPNIEGGICLREGLNYLSEIGLTNIHQREDLLLAEATECLKNIDGIRFIGTAPNKSSILSFIIEGIHPYDIGVLLDQQGIAVRTGHHCTQPIMDFYEIPGTIRASFSFYNNPEDISRLEKGLKKAIKMIG
jgi:cysteine desulfurase / selenocysteine lyase